MQISFVLLVTHFIQVSKRFLTQVVKGTLPEASLRKTQVALSGTDTYVLVPMISLSCIFILSCIVLLGYNLLVFV